MARRQSVWDTQAAGAGLMGSPHGAHGQAARGTWVKVREGRVLGRAVRDSRRAAR